MNASRCLYSFGLHSICSGLLHWWSLAVTNIQLMLRVAFECFHLYHVVLSQKHVIIVFTLQQWLCRALNSEGFCGLYFMCMQQSGTVRWQSGLLGYYYLSVIHVYEQLYMMNPSCANLVLWRCWICDLSPRIQFTMVMTSQGKAPNIQLKGLKFSILIAMLTEEFIQGALCMVTRIHKKLIYDF